MYRKLISWSLESYSQLPWRIARTRYTTLVSEIMLQQTTVSTVMNHYPRFIEKYPTLADLSKITEEQMLIEWKGLGYYRRARNLLGAVKEIDLKFSGEIPVNFESLTSIKGIGAYTANAIIAIGENQKALCVDANLERVLSRIYGISETKGPKLQKEIYRLFEQGEICHEVNDIDPRALNEALMDLGRRVCKARSASCEICSIRTHCFAGLNKVQNQFPVEKKTFDKDKEQKYFELNLLRVIVERDGKILAYKKKNHQWLAGQYELPTLVISSEDKECVQYPFLIKSKLEPEMLKSFKTSITKYRIKNFVLHTSEDDLRKISSQKFDWVDDYKHLSTASHKALLI